MGKCLRDVEARTVWCQTHADELRVRASKITKVRIVVHHAGSTVNCPVPDSHGCNGGAVAEGSK